MGEKGEYLQSCIAAVLELLLSHQLKSAFLSSTSTISTHTDVERVFRGLPRILHDTEYPDAQEGASQIIKSVISRGMPNIRVGTRSTASDDHFF